MNGTLETLEGLVVAAIVLLSLRRAVMLVAALLPPRRADSARALPTVTILIPARNERAVAGRLLEALDRVDYPPEALSVVLVADGCSDDTPALLRAWADGRARVRVIELPEGRGKAGALNAGLEVATSELVVVLDADLSPHSDFLRELTRPFGDDGVAAAAAFLRPTNANANLVARYAAVTTWVHQLVTSAGCDRLELNPPTLGASAYRRDALEQIGGFPLVPVGEDVATSARLIHAGWRTRFIESAVADNVVASDVRAFWRQHIRWSRSAGRFHVSGGATAASFAQRFELLASSIGYGDRVVFAIAAGGALAGILSGWVPLVYLIAPGLEIVAALFKARVGWRIPWFLCATLLFFPVDLLASLVAMLVAGTRRSYEWHNPRMRPIDAAAE